MIVYAANPKESTQNFLELRSQSSKIAGYKINTQKPITFLYAISEHMDTKIKNSIPFTTAKEKKGGKEGRQAGRLTRYKSNNVI